MMRNQTHDENQPVFAEMFFKIDWGTAKTITLLTAILLSAGELSAQQAPSELVLPQSGLWQGWSTVQEVQGCTAEIRADIKARAQGQALYSDRASFNKPFSLDQFEGIWQIDADWSQKSPNIWHGSFVGIDRSPFGRVTKNTSVTTFIRSDSLVEQSAIVTMAFSPDLAKKLGAQSPCIINMRIVHRRVGP